MGGGDGWRAPTASQIEEARLSTQALMRSNVALLWLGIFFQIQEQPGHPKEAGSGRKLSSLLPPFLHLLRHFATKKRGQTRAQLDRTDFNQIDNCPSISH